jgi:hypothetical protein
LDWGSLVRELGSWDNLFGAAEIESQFQERIRNTWAKTHFSLAYNRTNNKRNPQKNKGKYLFQQYGGVALLSTTQAAHRVLSSGKDPAGMGRWTWTHYQGKATVSLKVVSAYRPCLSDGALGTYSQQVNHLYEQNDDRCPRQAFLEDLKIEAYKWITAGEQVIIMLDANGGVRDGDIQQMFSELGMCESIIELHGNF